MKLDDRKCFSNILFACRVRFHKSAGINDLDEWPGVKVSISLRLMQQYGLLTNCKTWVERIGARPTVEVGVNVGK